MKRRVSFIHSYKKILMLLGSLLLLSCSLVLTSDAVTDYQNWTDFPQGLYIKKIVRAESAELSWRPVEGATGYTVYQKISGSYVKLAALKGTTYKVANLTPGENIRFAVSAYAKVDDKTYSTKKSTFVYHVPEDETVLAETERKRSAGYVPEIMEETVAEKVTVSTGRKSSYYAGVSPVSQFTDKDGKFCYAYESGNYVYICPAEGSKLKIKKMYQLVGAVTSDDKGNYYLVCGNEDTKNAYNTATIAISKYKNDGTLVKTLEVIPKKEDETKLPFNAGNCCVCIKDDVLLCFFARQTYTSQNSGLLAVSTDTMEKIEAFDPFVPGSHSFDQRVISSKDRDCFFMVECNDCYPRGFRVTSITASDIDSWVPFHFFAEKDGMKNKSALMLTKAELGGICESSCGLYISGASAKSLNATDYKKESKNLFLQNISDSFSLPGASIRQGTAFEDTVSDSNVKWITNYPPTSSAENPQMIYTTDDKIVLLWEKYDNGKFSATYYCVVSGDGTVLLKPTCLNSIRLNADESPLYVGGKIYWVSAVNGNLIRYALKPGGLKVPKVTSFTLSSSNDSVSLSWKADKGLSGFEIEQYDGKAYKKIKTVKADVRSFTVSGLNPGTTYAFRIRIVDKVEKSVVRGATESRKISTLPEKVGSLKAGNYKTTSAVLTWKKVKNTQGYLLYQKIDGKFKKVKTLSKDIISYSLTGLKSGETYYFRLRTYRKVNGVMYYGAASDTAKVCTLPGKVTGLKVSSFQKSRVTLSWKAVSGATGYKIYRMDAKKAVLLKRTSGSAVQYVAEGLQTASKYRFCVRAYCIIDKKDYHGTMSAVIDAVTRPDEAQLKPLASGGKGKLTVRWNPVNGASGYMIQYSTNPSFAYPTVTKYEALPNCVLSGLASKTTYYVRIRPYLLSNGEKIFSSSFSNTQKTMVQ